MRFKNKQITVTGAAGFIGRKLVEVLVDEGAKVTAVDLPGVPFPNWPSVECLAVALNSATNVEKICRDKDFVFHLAFPVSDWEKEDKFQRALELTEELCKFASQNVFRLIITTSVVVYADNIGKGPIDENTPYGKPNGHYMAYKQKQERIALASAQQTKADIRIVRPANVYGAGSKPWVIEAARVLAKGMPALIDSGRGRAGLVLVDNVVEALLVVALAKLNPGEIFVVADENVLTWRDYFSEIAALIGTGQPKSIPRFLAEVAATSSEFAWKTLNLAGRPPLTRQALMLVGADNDFRSDKLREQLGFTPVKTHVQGMAEIAEYLSLGTWRE